MRSVVTGAARGIGKAVADRLEQDGYDVLRVDLADGFVADVTSPEDRARIVAEAGPVDVLVNNAGITRDARIVKMTEEQFLAVIRVNLGAAYELTRALTLNDGASVVSLASRAYLGNFGQFNYSASKGGLVGMTRALALELAPRVRVNAIAPSLTASEMTRAMPEHVLEKMIASIPLGRQAEPEEIAETIAALASPATAYVTGQVLVACGGRSLAP
ncbi:acetoacetyl-CoA reductase/3-oxoacyl-[acyl-carrier protein] reductase [Solirubrobacter pauli]|uniref:Acetoacetyl-CoA reductase/3-oxoacyl-[acyl-carrier protein] reductase n=1 Tax=Solirubrobacter pauli TaxID=166793 RepID=A0A660KZB3_9ACTN|nr:SDR family oxidoreductase [Solirubrobacter pauli]RKQ86415.1 acetoacetyl-CoA reductase/3-oxoacyl-[acyl-carrier protein] reductase [Solirubrobacter pauli]